MSTGCATTPAGPISSSRAASAVTESGGWACRNHLEVYCRDGACEVADLDQFTPMSIHLEDAGALSVCAYTGCWEGQAEVVDGDPFLVALGNNLPFSTASDDAESDRDVALVIDRSDGVATLKVGVFAQPLLCTRKEP